MNSAIKSGGILLAVVALYFLSVPIIVQAIFVLDSRFGKIPHQLPRPAHWFVLPYVHLKSLTTGRIHGVFVDYERFSANLVHKSYEWLTKRDVPAPAHPLPQPLSSPG